MGGKGGQVGKRGHNGKVGMKGKGGKTGNGGKVGQVEKGGKGKGHGGQGKGKGQGIGGGKNGEPILEFKRTAELEELRERRVRARFAHVPEAYSDCNTKEEKRNWWHLSILASLNSQFTSLPPG